MASRCHLTLFLCLTSGLFIAETFADETEPQAGGCPAGWTQSGSRCFIFYHVPKIWTEAEDACISLGGNLASIHSEEEHFFLRDLIHRVSGYHALAWIGAFDAVKEGVWMWSDGSKFDYSPWGVGEPNNYGIEHCAEMNWGANYWNDSRCEYAKFFICAKDATLQM